MEAAGSPGPLTSHPRTPPDLTAPRPPRDTTKRTPRSPGQDVRFARNPPLAGRETTAGHRGGRITRQPSGASKPLVPLTERKSQEESTHAWRIKNNSEGDKTDITPDGGSAGREGRQFTVANVGNNGRIYLRWDSLRLPSTYSQPPELLRRSLARDLVEEVGGSLLAC